MYFFFSLKCTFEGKHKDFLSCLDLIWQYAAYPSNEGKIKMQHMVWFLFLMERNTVDHQVPTQSFSDTQGYEEIQIRHILGLDLKTRFIWKSRCFILTFKREVATGKREPVV